MPAAQHARSSQEGETAIPGGFYPENLRQDSLGQGGFRGSKCMQTPLVKHRDPIGVTARQVQVMQGADHAAPLVRLGPKHLHGFKLMTRIERGNGFIGKQDRGPRRQQARQMKARLFEIGATAFQSDENGTYDYDGAINAARTRYNATPAATYKANVWSDLWWGPWLG